MSRLHVLNASEQVANHLRQELINARWTGTMPGEHQLVNELGISHNTVKAALRQLEREGLLIAQGAGKRRRIAQGRKASPGRGLKVGILLYAPEDMDGGCFRMTVKRLEALDCQLEVANKTLTDLNLKLERVKTYVARHPAGAWVVFSGPKDVLQWFAAQPTPAFALFGRSVEVPIASTFPYKSDAVKQLIEHLIELGHSRIVLLTRKERRKPRPGFIERLVFETMEAHGIRTGTYNLPDWQETKEGLHDILDSLFGHTPPTAIVIDDPYYFVPVMQHLANRGLTAPENISLACLDSLRDTDWCVPSISQITWENDLLAKRVADWIRQISKGKDDRRKRPVAARLVFGGTIGAVPTDRDLLSRPR